jgi:hypothetical protein
VRRDAAADTMEANGSLLAGRSLVSVCGYKATVVPEKGIVLTESQPGGLPDVAYWCVAVLSPVHRWQFRRATCLHWCGQANRNHRGGRRCARGSDT